MVWSGLRDRDGLTVAERIDRGLAIRLIILKARREGICLSPDTRILTADLRWIAIDEVLVGQQVLAVDEEAQGGPRRLARKMRTATVEDRREVWQPAFRLTFEDGRVLIATGPHRFLSRQHGGTETQWRAVEDFRVGDVVRTVTEPWGPAEYEDGWFGGLLDGEGTVRPKSRAGCEATVSQLHGAVYDRAMKYLKDRGYHPRESLDHYPHNHHDGYNRKPIGRIVIGRLNELLRLIGHTRPSRLPSTWWQGKDLPGKKSGVAWVRVASIEALDIQRMIDLQTSTKTFIAEGFVSHNSTEIESWLMAMIAAGDLVNALVTAHQIKAAQRIWAMSKRFVTSSPLLKKLATIGNNTIALGQSTLEVATAGNPESERSGDLTAWHASEAAFYKFPEVMVATMQTLPPPNVFSIGVIESTANGKVGDGHTFYQEWLRAEEGDSDWMPMFLSWLIFDDYQLPGLEIEEPDAEEQALRDRFQASDARLAWRRWAIANLCQGSIDKFHQEYPSYPEEAFIQSGLPFFRNEHLLPLEAHVFEGARGVVAENGQFTKSPNGWLELFKMPEAGHDYVIGADSSFGIDDDDELTSTHSRSAGQVLDMDTLEQVAEYDAASAPHLMARHLVGMARLYNNALLAPEVQSAGGGGGRELIVYIRDMDYWNIHRWRAQPDKIQRDQPILLGWETNARTRPRMLARIRQVVMEQSAIIHSRRLMNQLASFGENDAGRMESLQGHDDLLFAWGIALMSRSENYFKLVQPPPAAILNPDWEKLGLHVVRAEHPEARLRRLLAIADTETPERSFLEL